jgi:iron complex outermembrane receptor protein
MAQENEGVMDDITVTARRVEERLQDVPIAVSAFSADEMVRRNMRELEDIALATPGFSYEDYGGGFGVPVIRGGSQLRIQDLDQTTSVYLDGVYLPRQYMVDFGTVGFERIEVVKGPQSALYGRNAFLGAVNYVSGGPGDELSAQVRATVGSDDRYDVYAEAGGPFADDRFGARVLLAYTEFDGTWDNDHPNAGLSFDRNGTEENLGGWENTTFGINLEARPIEQLGLELDYYRIKRFQEQEANIRVEASAGDTNCSFDPDFLGGANRFYCGDIPETFVPLPGGSPPGADQVVDPRSYLLDVETDFLHLGANLQIAEGWSGVYQFGYSDNEVTSAGGGDRDALAGSFNFFDPPTPVNYFNMTPVGTNEYYSHELRIQFDQGPWTAFIGGFTSRIRDFDLFDLTLGDFLDSRPFSVDPENGVSGATALALTRAKTTVETNAVFGRVGWRSNNDRWGLGVEARYAEDKKELDSNTTDPTAPQFDDDWDIFTPRFTAEYRFNPDQLLYFSAAKGEKSGGFNNTVFNESQRTFDPDENWTYELGSKNEIFDGRLRINAAVYFTDWDNLQINSAPLDIPPGATPPAIVANTGGAEILGFELEGVWVPLDNLSFDYALSYTDAEYSDDSKSARIGLIGACDGITCPEDGDIDGNQLQRQPEWQFALGGQVDGVIAGDWEWLARADVEYQDEQYIDELNLTKLPDRTLLNARVELNRGPWTAALWAKNLTDEEYAANAFFIVTPFGTSYVPIFGAKRTWGLTVTFAL